MSSNERLRQARLAAGYATVSAASEAMAANRFTYAQHENGIRPISRNAAEKYSRFYRISLDWLVTGRGEMRGRARSIPIMGVVGAGATVATPVDEGYVSPPDELDLPSPDSVMAFVVRGDSQYPRFMDGEYVVVERTPSLPESLVGRLALVQTNDGRQMLKTVKRGRSQGRFVLASHNAPDIDDVQLLGAHRVRAIVTL